jgi:hypothetical protein
MKRPSVQRAKWRVRIAFFLLFVFTIALSAGAYVIMNFSKLQERIAAREVQATVQGITDSRQLDDALRRYPSSKILKMIEMAVKATAETSAAAEQLAKEGEPAAISKEIDFGTASRGDLEALRRDLKAAEVNATSFMPRYVALLKTERDKLAAYALSLHAEKDLLARFMEAIDKRHADATALASRSASARADYYRTYERYVAVLAGEFGAYKVVNGEFNFPLQRTAQRYNAAAEAMTAAAGRMAALEEERSRQMQAQQAGWEQLVSGK